MKKILVILLGLSILWSLCACGAKDEGDKGASTSTDVESPADGGSGGTFQGNGYTIDYPSTVEEQTSTFGEKQLVDKGGAFEVIPQVYNDTDYETTVNKWVESQKSFEGYSAESIEVAGLSGMKITYVDSVGAIILYLVKLNDNEALALSFYSRNLSGTIEELSDAPGVQQILDGIKVSN